MKRLLSISFLSILLVMLCSLSLAAKTQTSRTLYVYVHTPSVGGTLKFGSPAIKTVSLSNSNGATVKMDDYTYIGGILLDFDAEGINASKVTITCYDENYSKTISYASHVQEFIPLSTAKTTSIYITFSK